MARAVAAGVEAGVPIVGIVDGLGAAAASDPAGLAALCGWGAVAHSFAEASGLVPTVLVVDGPCLAGMALLLGLADVVILTRRATAYVNDPAAAATMTGTMALDAAALGGTGVHASQSGVASLVAGDLDEALALAGDVLAHLPPNNGEHPPHLPTPDPVERGCAAAAAAVPADGRRAYDVRNVIVDIADGGEMVELRAGFGTSLVTALARVGGVPVGVVANQPNRLAGALDIEASQKAARFVRWCDAFGVALLTLVDTPGFRPGKDQEWRGMIRHGAQLAFAYAEATVPRGCVLLRKAYGGAFIVMDCTTMGNDACFAWPGAEVAVMGAAGAVEILNRRDLAAAADPVERALVRKRLEAAYEETFLTPTLAAERGYIDAVIEPASTRAVVARALAALHAKREHLPARRHANTPL
jgi:acetyl-CoA carboxylase carboxyltransferase component